MIGASDLAKIEARAAAASGDRWRAGRAEDGSPVVSIEFMDGRHEVVRITREREPAGDGDVDFIAHARGDVMRLAASLRAGPALTEEELVEIEARYSRASRGPWKAFLESDGGTGGCDVIWVSDGDDEPDLYVWMGDELAPGADFEFIAAARQDVPILVAAARRRRSTAD